MPDQTSFRLPREMLRKLARAARERGIPKSQLVREALEAYLANLEAGQTSSLTVRERSAPYIGSISLGDETRSGDVAVRIRRNNWRK